MLNAIDSLATCITTNESRIACGPPPTAEMGRSRIQASTLADTPPEAGPYTTEAPPRPEKEGLPQVENEVRARITNRLRGAPTTYLHLEGDESDHEEPAPAAIKYSNPGVSSKLRMFDTTMIISVMWPHAVVYSPTIVYENISSMVFIDGYITIMSRESLPIKKLMSQRHTHSLPTNPMSRTQVWNVQLWQV